MSCRSRPPYRPGHGWISGVAFLSTLAATKPASRGFTCVRCCSSPPAFSPRALAVPRSCPWLTVASNRPCKGLAPPIGHSYPTHSVALRAPCAAPESCLFPVDMGFLLHQILPIHCPPKFRAGPGWLRRDVRAVAHCPTSSASLVKTPLHRI